MAGKEQGNQHHRRGRGNLPGEEVAAAEGECREAGSAGWHRAERAGARGKNACSQERTDATEGAEMSQGGKCPRQTF